MTVSNSFQLNLHPVTALTQLTGCPYSFSVPLLSSPYRHLLCVWTGEAVSRGCVSQSQPCFPLTSLSLKMSNLWYSLSFLQPSHHQDLSKGRSGKRGITGGISVEQAGLLESTGADSSCGFGTAAVGSWFHPVTWWPPMHHPYGEGGHQKKCTMPITLQNQPNWSMKTLLRRYSLLPRPFLPIPAHVFSPSWFAEHCIYNPASEPPHLAHFLAEL